MTPVTRSLLVPFVVGAVLSVLAATGPAGAQATPTCDGKAATIVGTPGNDRIVGTPGNDVIVGLGGKDKIFGLAGNDTICGGDGPDLLKGQRGRDKLFGGQGNDRIQGNNGKDTIHGGTGRDNIVGGRGADTITSGGGADIVDAGNDGDTCRLDRRDVFSFCEAGDVRGASGFGNATVEVNVPDDFRVHRAGSGSFVRDYYVVELYGIGTSDFDFHSFEFRDADGNFIDVQSEGGAEYSGEFLLDDKPAQVIIETPGAWEVVVKRPKLVERLGSSVNGFGSHVYFLLTPLGENAEGSFLLSDNVEGNVVLWTYAPGRFGDLRVNEIHPREDGVDLYEGPERAGTYLVEVIVDFGDWELTFTDTAP